MYIGRESDNGWYKRLFSSSFLPRTPTNHIDPTQMSIQSQIIIHFTLLLLTTNTEILHKLCYSLIKTMIHKHPQTENTEFDQLRTSLICKCRGRTCSCRRICSRPPPPRFPPPRISGWAQRREPEPLFWAKPRSNLGTSCTRSSPRRSRSQTRIRTFLRSKTTFFALNY